MPRPRYNIHSPSIHSMAIVPFSLFPDIISAAGSKGDPAAPGQGNWNIRGQALSIQKRTGLGIQIHQGIASILLPLYGGVVSADRFCLFVKLIIGLLVPNRE